VAFDEKSLDDYIDVAQRIADFREVYPDGRLQAAEPWRIIQVQSEWCIQCVGRRTVKERGGNWKACPRCKGTGLRGEGEPALDTFIVYVAAAYRTPDDPRPGIGCAWEPYPGRTPYTAGSELMNAETSAWGRALQAALVADTKTGVASREEVRNRRAERDDGLPVNRDGSLSRSQTTDEEKDAAGVMTSEQHAEHTSLIKGADGKLPPSEHAKVQHLPATPPDDPFYNIPGSNGAEPEARPRSADDEQIREINIRFGGIGVKDRAAKLAWLSDWAKRPIKSSKDLSMVEAAELLRSVELPPVKAKAAI
jgi:hypothetical protein